MGTRPTLAVMTAAMASSSNKNQAYINNWLIQRAKGRPCRVVLLTSICGVTLPQGHLWPDSGFLSSAPHHHNPAQTCTLRHEPRLPGARRPGPIQAIIITQANIYLATVDTIQ